MPTTQNPSEADTKELEADTNFSYVPALSDSLKRVAAFYEYARESAELIDAVVELREAGTFKPGCKKRDVKPELLRMLLREAEMFPKIALVILAESDDFPRKPFRDALQNSEILKGGNFTLGISPPVELPWKTLILLRQNWTRWGLNESEFYEDLSRGSKTLHAILIDWNYTNEELAAFIRELIPRIRPSGAPEPKKAGRRGRRSGTGAVDMLNQLAAFRLNRAGIDFADSGKRTLYVSRMGWAKAVRSAQERINNMTKRPFFG